jgi:hypothetical protein
MKRVLTVAAVAEMATGLGLLTVPSLVAQMLLGEPLIGNAIPVARVAGIALVAFGIACWPGPPSAGMLIYSAAVALYLAYLGFAAGFAGALLCPAVCLHAFLTALLAFDILRMLRDLRQPANRTGHPDAISEPRVGVSTRGPGSCGETSGRLSAEPGIRPRRRATLGLCSTAAAR